MKKKILISVLVLCIISTLCFALVGCVGTRYDFTKFYKFEEEETKSISHMTRNAQFESTVANSKHLTGSLYQFTGASNSNYVLFDIVDNKRIGESSVAFSVDRIGYNNIVIMNLVCGYVQYSQRYDYYLPNGQLIYTSIRRVTPNLVSYNHYEKTCTIDFEGNTKIVKILNRGYSVSEDSGQHFLQKDETVGASGDNDFAKNAGLNYHYTIDIIDSQIIVIKNAKIVSTFTTPENGTLLTMNNGRIFYVEKTAVPDDSEDYTVLDEGVKYKVKYKSFNLKNGKTKEIKSDYLFVEKLYTGNNADCLVGMKKINKDKTLNDQMEYFIVSGKGIVANVNKSFALADYVYPLNSSEFLITTDKGSYITNKYLEIKKDLTQVEVESVFVNQKILLASQTINGKTKYGMIDFKGKVVTAFNYDTCIQGGNAVYMKSNNSNSYSVYNVNNIKQGVVRSFADSCDTNYLEDDIIMSISNGNVSTIENAFTGYDILTANSLRIEGTITSYLGQSTIRIYNVAVSSSGPIYKTSIVVIKNN